MTNSIDPLDLTVHNQDALEELAWAIAASQGEFALLLARCNYANLRSQLIEQLQARCQPLELRLISLRQSSKTLYSCIREELESGFPDALMITGFESVENLDEMLAAVNSVREEFRKNYPFPIVLWITEGTHRQWLKLAPDFESWATTTDFHIHSKVLMQALHEAGDRLFATLLAPDIDRFYHFLKQESNLGFFKQEINLGFLQSSEVDSALKEVLTQGQILDPELQACVDFGQGLSATDDGEALGHYQRSLEYWQTQQPLRAALVLFYIGYTRFKVAEKTLNPEWEQVRQPLQQCITMVQPEEAPGLIARSITWLERTLQKLEDWKALETLAQRGQVIHQQYGTPILLVQDYGFLARAALEQQQWTVARQTTQQGLEILEQIPTDRRWLEQRLLMFLAQAERSLNQTDRAIAHLQQAQALGDQGYPKAHIRALQELHDLYFEQHQYLEAFQTKQEQLSIEQQYGIRAFVGAGRLRAKREEGQAELWQIYTPVPVQGKVAAEIEAAGRQHDLERLLERIGRNDSRLIVIHGNSGVGKSSLVNAGLVPALRRKPIGIRANMPVVTRVYTNWAEELHHQLERSLQQAGRTTEHLTAIDQPSSDSLLTVFRQLDAQNLRLVLIFDQFEEFFFVYPQPEQRRSFFQFLAECLQILSLNVVVLLREDYLHLLLECDRLPEMSNTGIDILSQNVRYPLGNFSPTGATAIINTLIDRARIYFDPEPALIEQLVQDLAEELGAVRPIELQIVGAQLQADQITRLAQYQALGADPKNELVERYLADVVKDCGKENDLAAQLVLYLLTNENDTRPLKTKAELAENMGDEASKLDLVLEILSRSGLVMLLPEVPADRYQLVHDYLVPYIRREQTRDLLKDLAEEREQRKLSDEKLKHFLKRALAASMVAGMGFAGLAILAVGSAQQADAQRKRAEIGEFESLNQSSELQVDSGRNFAALLDSFRAVERLKQTDWATPDRQMQTTALLQQSIYRVQERNTLDRHTAQVWGVSFSPDGKTIASASADKTVKLWNAEGKELKTLKGHTAEVYGVSFSPVGASLSSDIGKTIASASLDKTVKLWNAAGKELKTLRGHTAAVWGVSFSPDGKTIASASADNTVKLWNAEGKELKTLKGHTAGVYGVSFSPDSKTIASASLDKTVKLWNAEGKELKTLRGHTAAVWGVSFSPDGKTIATASLDKTVKLWNAEGKELKTLKGHTAEVYGVSFSPDGKTIASASLDNTVKLWNAAGKELKTLKGHTAAVYGVSFSPDGKTIASASLDKTVKLWNAAGKELKTLKGHTAEVIDVSFSPVGASLSSDIGKTIASASLDNTVKLWNADGKELKTLKGHTAAVNGVSFSPDGKTIASASLDKTVKLWNADGKELKTLKGHTAEVIGVSFSPDGKTIASASLDKTVKLWNAAGKELKTLKGHTAAVIGVSFSPDGKTIASASLDNTVKLWNAEGKELKTLKGHTAEVNGVSFSPDSKTIVSASWDNTVKLWNADGKELKTLKGHTAAVYGVSFSPDGKTIASASEDKTVKLWNAAGKELKTLKGHTAAVYGVSFSPDGKTIASASLDNTVKLWNLNFGDLVAQGCDWLKDYLTTHPDALEELSGCQTPALWVAAAPTWVMNGDDLARAGKQPEAITLYRKAQSRNPGLKFDPATKAQQLTSQGAAERLIDESTSHAKRGEVKDALSAVSQAQALYPQVKITVDDWDNLCWYGSLHGSPRNVLFACEKSVAMAPQDELGYYRDARGVARAMTGNTAGAVADFQAYTRWITESKRKAKRQRWIKDLQAGRNPFTPAEIKKLLE